MQKDISVCKGKGVLVCMYQGKHVLVYVSAKKAVVYVRVKDIGVCQVKIYWCVSSQKILVCVKSKDIGVSSQKILVCVESKDIGVC